MSAAPSSAARKLFGTDGVRGVAGEFLSAELALALARAATSRVQTDGRPARVLVAADGEQELVLRGSHALGLGLLLAPAQEAT